MKNLILLFFLIYSLSLLAQEVTVKVTSKIKGDLYDLGIGSEVELDFKRTNEQKHALFLGKMVSQDGSVDEFLFLDLDKTRVLMINPENLKGFRKSTSQAIVRPIEQKGSTCTAYGLFHFWDQMYSVGLKGNSELMSTMESDRKRVQFVEEAIDIYYLQNRTNITTLMKMYGKRFGFNCKNHPFKDPKEATEFIFNTVTTGRPVLLDFNIGSDMVSSTYEVMDYERPVSPDPRLWIPRRVGERANGGHVIVAAAGFIAKGRKKILVIDSDWGEPRVWDLAKYMGKKSAVKEMGFHTCQ